MVERERPIYRVFVYGTLKTGQCRQSAWPVKPLSIESASIQGHLYSREDYPALMPGNHRVMGQCWSFTADQIERVLATLDEIEGTNGNSPADLYHRRIVDVTIVSEQLRLPAYTYFYHRDPIADGFTSAPVVDGSQSWPA